MANKHRYFKYQPSRASHIRRWLRTRTGGGLSKRTSRARGRVIAPVPGGRGVSERIAHMREVPTIAFRGSDGNKRAYVRGTPFDVWEIVEAYKAMGLKRMLTESDLSRDEIGVALGYYKKHRQEIERLVEANRGSEDEWRKLYPDVFVLRSFMSIAERPRDSVR